MKRVVLFCWFVISLSVTLNATAFPSCGIDSTSSEFFREYYHQGDLVHWLDIHSDYAVYLSETTGGWHLPDDILFSVQGNPYSLNHYYIDGFRIDNKFRSGSTMYRPNMLFHSLATDTYHSRLYFTTDSLQRDFASITGFAGGLGGVSPSSIYLISLYHNSARERFYYETDLSHPHDGRSTGLFPEDYRPHIQGAGQLETAYGIKSRSGKRYMQHLYADFGWRSVPDFNEGGICGAYTDSWYKVQADGQLPLRHRETDPSLHYLLNLSSRGSMGQEYYYNRDEVMHNDTWSASLYCRSPKNAVTNWTAGLTWTTNTARHAEPCFTRNMVDQDGEAFEPWNPDGLVHELTASATLTRPLLPWLQLRYDGANSLLLFSPRLREWHNNVYWRSMFGEENHSLYTIQWQASPFAAGLLENTLGLRAAYAPVWWFSLQADLDATLDGVLLADGKSFVRPNLQACLSLSFQPCQWFQGSLTLADCRMTFDISHAQFFSDRYMNGRMFYDDGTLFGTTGGLYHRMDNAPWQPRYCLIDLPLRFTIGRHEISVLSTYKKFYSLWSVEFAGPAAEYGFYTMPDPMSGCTQPVFFYNGGERQYVVTSAPQMGGNILNNTPYFASNIVKYAYNGKKWYVSLSWQSFIMTSTSALGNGILANDVQVLSESLANPNSRLVTENGDTYALTGRANQDRAYIGRLLVAYNINKNWNLGLTFKFEDGQPFSNYSYSFLTDDAQHTQVAVWNRRSRGINPTNGNFGSRKDAFFDLDVNVSYNAVFANGQELSVQLIGYNLYDFATELTEFVFEEKGGNHRYAMSLCVPRGLRATLMYKF